MNETAPSSAATSACTGHPFVSIVLCTVGNRPTLERCLDSLVAQGCQRFEILLVLNGPFDPAFPQRVASYPVRLLHEPRRGVSIARNTALGQARGEILAIVDDDIVADAAWLHEIVKGFQDPAVACVIGRVIPEGPSYWPEERHKTVYFSERAITPWYQDAGPEGIANVLNAVVMGFGCNLAFRKNFLENFSLLPEDLGAGSVIGSYDEPYMFLQVLKHGFRIYYTPFAVVTHFFEEEAPRERKSRLRHHCAAALAFRLKLLLDEKGYRVATLKSLLIGFYRVVRTFVGRKNPLEPPEMLSFSEKLSAHLRGFRLFWRSRQRKDSPE
ncbi:MAG: glycosyltransferase family 2 protein [Acidobacteria bacterium]|nr:glycosyltransferase family 2 protein [Acidobacteriota bacterium]